MAGRSSRVFPRCPGHPLYLSATVLSRSSVSQDLMSPIPFKCVQRCCSQDPMSPTPFKVWSFDIQDNYVVLVSQSRWKTGKCWKAHEIRIAVHQIVLRQRWGCLFFNALCKELSVLCSPQFPNFHVLWEAVRISCVARKKVYEAIDTHWSNCWEFGFYLTQSN